MFRKGIVREVTPARVSEAPSRTPQQSWVESRLDRILQERRDLACCVTLCCTLYEHCTNIARALHEHCTNIARAKDNVPLIKTYHDVCPSTFGLDNSCNCSSKVLGSFDMLRQHATTAFDCRKWFGWSSGFTRTGDVWGDVELWG